MLSIEATNLVVYLENLVPPEGMCKTVEIRRRENAPVDVRFFFGDRSWLVSSEGKKFLENLAVQPFAGDVRLKGAMLSLRFADAFIADLGARLERDADAGMSTSAILAGRAFMVGFAGPNTSKALHVGHLRNVTIGNALAAVLAAAGADVVRASLVGDIGRNICEAMAGYRLFHDGEDPVVLGMKPDHFIGACYARYIREHTTHGDVVGGNADPIERELANTGDAADRFMQGWLAGDPDVRALWGRVRTWVMEGHRRTLARFGVVIDRHDFEADGMDDVPPILERGVRMGVLEREPDGTVVYRSGRQEFETMILARDDGFPTEHARLLAVYSRMLAERPDNCTYIDLSGAEWQPPAALHAELMHRIWPERPDVGHMVMFHGMVTLGNSKVSSSGGDALLMDELLDRLAGLEEIRAVADTSGGAVEAETVSDIVVKSFFVCRPHMKEMSFSWELLLQQDNPGWTIARAWCAAVAPDGRDDAEFPTDLYRLLVLRSQEYRRNLEAAAVDYDLAGLASYLLHYCSDYLAAPHHPRLKRLARNVIRRGLYSLGLADATA